MAVLETIGKSLYISRSLAMVFFFLMSGTLIGGPPGAPTGTASAADPVPADPFHVSELHYAPANPEGTAFWMWVNVTNAGTDDAENVTADFSGADLLAPEDWEGATNLTLDAGRHSTQLFTAYFGASVTVDAQVTAGPTDAVLRLTVQWPSGAIFDFGTGVNASVEVTPEDIAASGGAGDWFATVTSVGGSGPMNVSLTISTSYDPPAAQQALDTIPGGGSFSFRWLVNAGGPMEAPDTAVVVVNATVVNEEGAVEDVEYTAAYGQAVVEGAGEPPEGVLQPIEMPLAVTVAALWLLAPFVALMAVRKWRRPGGLAKGTSSNAKPTDSRPAAAPVREQGHRSKTRAKLMRKVPEITVLFWVIKVLCTTVGETAADQLNGTSLASPLALGLSGTNWLMTGLLLLALIIQFVYPRYVPAVYWIAVVLVSVVGTLITDHLHDDLGVGLDALTAAFAVVLAATFWVWYRSEKTLSIHSVYTPRREAFYWAAILATFALGTASGDLVLERLGTALGTGPSPDDPSALVPLYPQAALLMSGALFGGIIAAAFLAGKFTRINAVLLFWIAYIFTRPLGANIGDVLTLPPDEGGLGFDKVAINIAFLLAILASVGYLTLTKEDVFEKAAARSVASPAAAKDERRRQRGA